MMRNKKETIGKLDRQITIQRRALVENATGERVETWSNLLTVWASVIYPKSGVREDVTEGAVYATNRANFEIRKTDVTVFDRVVYNGDNWDIIRISEQGRNDRLILETQVTE